jgi:hypothetical protein
MRKGIRIVQVRANKAAAERFGAVKRSSLENLDILTSQQIAPRAFLARRETESPLRVSIMKSMDDNRFTGRRCEFPDKRSIPKGI